MNPSGKPNPIDITFPSDTGVRIARTFDAPRPLVWAAWTTPEHMQRWMLGPEGWTMPVCEMDFRPGGAWRYVWRRDIGTEMEMTGAFREIVPMEMFVSTERWGEPWPETINTMTFLDEGDRTTVVITILYPSKDARDAALKTGMDDGMAISYARLDALLETIG